MSSFHIVWQFHIWAGNVVTEGSAIFRGVGVGGMAGKKFSPDVCTLKMLKVFSLYYMPYLLAQAVARELIMYTLGLLSLLSWKGKKMLKVLWCL